MELAIRNNKNEYKFHITIDYYKLTTTILYWLDKNTIGKIEVVFKDNGVVNLLFEREDDLLLYKIKFM
jgi:hypothetical protein